MLTRYERIEFLLKSTGSDIKVVRRNLPKISDQLRKKWNTRGLIFDAIDSNGRALEMRLLLIYFRIPEGKLLKLNWRKFKKSVSKELGQEFVQCFNRPKPHWIVSKISEDRDYFNLWVSDKKP